MKAAKILYTGTPWWLLLLIPAVFFRFYSAYIEVIVGYFYCQRQGLGNVCNMDHELST